MSRKRRALGAWATRRRSRFRPTLCKSELAEAKCTAWEVGWMTVRWRIPRIDRWSLALGTRPWSSDVSRPAVNAPLAQLPAGSMDKRKTLHHARSTGPLVPGCEVGWLVDACLARLAALELAHIICTERAHFTQNNDIGSLVRTRLSLCTLPQFRPV